MQRRVLAVMAFPALLLVAPRCIQTDRAPGPPTAPGTEATPLYLDVGTIHRTITTASGEAQLWFDRGLGLAYGFNHEAAIAAFEKGLEADPGCAMCDWGTAYALGPNYNNPQMPDEAARAALASLERAARSAASGTDSERALVAALRTRYASPAPDDRSALDLAYADAMREVHAAHPDDPDVAALTAEAVMMLHPWKLWSHEGEPSPVTPEVRAILEAGLARWPDHPALCHLYIHTMEAGPEVARAVEAAEALESFRSGLGHLVHMPSHIYVWTGRYDDVVRVNRRAVEIDEAYVAHVGRDNFYTLYRLHNLHFVAYGGMWTGQRAMALAAARRIADEIPAAMLAAFPDFLDVFVGTPYHVMVRFGMWEEILAEPAPAAPELAATRAIRHYARGVALAALGRVDEALAEQASFRRARAAVPESRLLFNNPVSRILAVADRVLAGEIAYRRGDHDTAFALLREAVALDERLDYDEPWGWMEPTRHALGALLTEQGRHEEALEVYRADLARYPDNGWALHGMAESLRGLGRASEASEVEARFRTAWADAEVVIPGSCYCKTADDAS